MSQIKTTEIEGDVAVGRNVTAGGNGVVRGDMTVGHNLRVEGWADVPNLKGPLKGLFRNADDLRRAYVRPEPGWWALVGDVLPAQIWDVKDGKWAGRVDDSGHPVMGGDPGVDMTSYEGMVDDLSDAVESLEDRMDVAEADISGLTSDIIDLSMGLKRAENSLGTHGLRLDKVEEDISGLNETVGAHDVHLDRLDDDVVNMMSDISGLNETVGAHDVHLDRLDDDLINLGADVRDLEDADKEISKRVSILEVNRDVHDDAIEELYERVPVVEGMHLGYSNGLDGETDISGRSELRVRLCQKDGYWLGFGWHEGQTAVGMGYRTSERDAAVWTLEFVEGGNSGRVNGCQFVMRNRLGQYLRCGSYRTELVAERSEATVMAVFLLDNGLWKVCQADYNERSLGGDKLADWSPVYCNKDGDSNERCWWRMEDADGRSLVLLDGEGKHRGEGVPVATPDDVAALRDEMIEYTDTEVGASASTFVAQIELNKSAIDALASDVDKGLEAVSDAMDEMARDMANQLGDTNAEIGEARRELLEDMQRLTEGARLALFDDMWLQAGKIGGRQYSEIDRESNPAEPYLLNGVAHSYEDAVYTFIRTAVNYEADLTNMFYGDTRLKTHFPFITGKLSGNVCTNMFAGCTALEVAVMSHNYCNPSQANNLFSGCSSLREVRGVIQTVYAQWSYWVNVFRGCVSLEEFRLGGLKGDIDLHWSPRLSVESVGYLVRQKSVAAVLTVTVHEDVFAKLTGDVSNEACAALSDDERAAWGEVLDLADERGVTFATA